MLNKTSNFYTMTKKELDISYKFLLQVQDDLNSKNIIISKKKVDMLDKEILKQFFYYHVKEWDSKIKNDEIILKLTERVEQQRLQHRLKARRINLEAERMQKALQVADMSVMELLKERNNLDKEIEIVESAGVKISAEVQRVNETYQTLKARETKLRASASTAAAAAKNVPVPDASKPRLPPFLVKTRAAVRNMRKRVVADVLPPRIELWVSIAPGLEAGIFFSNKDKWQIDFKQQTRTTELGRGFAAPSQTSHMRFHP